MIKLQTMIRKSSNVVFAQGFGGIVPDLEIGPDGYLYIVSHTNREGKHGTISRLIPNEQAIVSP